MTSHSLLNTCPFFIKGKKGFAAASILLLAACGGGGEGGSGGGIGSGQSPDPVVVDIPIFFVQRPLPVDDNGNREADDVLDPAAFRPGAELVMRDRASPSAADTIITASVFAEDELYDVKDLEPSFDGEKLLFSMRAPEIPNADDDEQPTWNIWEYDRVNDVLRRIITSDTNARAGQDVAPHYLADGRIVFSSTRQRQARSILLDEGKPQYSGLTEDRDTEAFVLHVMEDDGSNIRQITYNQSHDLDPTVLSTGEVMFSRWDNSAGNNSISLYQINPDGRQLDFMYGYHSQDTGTNNSEGRFLHPRELPDNRVLVSLRPTQSDRLGGDMVAVNIADFTEIDQSEMSNPSAPNSGDGQQSLAFATVNTDGTPSPHGHFSSVFPLHDGSNRLLVSWAQCRLIDPADGTTIIPCTAANLALANVQEAPPLYGIWSYNLTDQSQQPIINGVEDTMFTEVVAMQPRTLPANIEDGVPGVTLDNDLLSENVGVLHIRSVYDLDGTDTTANGIAATSDPLQADFAARDARFLRVVKAVPMPDEDVLDFDNTAFGRSQNQLMREVLGYTPIQPDGSVKVKIPANVPFMISVLDADGRRISNQPIGGRHNNWLQLRPGEERECSGCHSATSELPHGRPNGEAPSINDGAMVTGVAFPNTTSTLFPDAGETMAETLSRINGVSELTVDLIFSDVWSDPTISTPDPDIQYEYADLATPHPTSLACQTNWTSNCRIVVNYPIHLQPLWDRDRQVFDTDGITLLQDNTCTSCHNIVDDNNMPMEPLGQLNLAGTPSTDEPDHLTSYRELLFPDNEQFLDPDTNTLQDVMVQRTDANGNLLFLLDADGNQVLDANGDPIPILDPVTVPASMSVNGALASPRFFSRFATGGSHEGYLDDAELKLLSEWIDIGGQYYNNPFDVPQN
ncbi:hypothetical protein QSV34_12530 [Porticoccus sp. W117]|uniref:HzsA-related protein n=1 Tax=Porticoccus sp. W117 TaxID=3054777 RepID=UPI0025997CD0|nr:hypothetical protein [Porticoccus sp. W117]MDM3872172.1 hypothetical protein [Porticoccus sp. W117]